MKQDSRTASVDDFDLPNLAAGTNIITRGFSIPSRSFDGLSMIIECHGKGRGIFRVHWSSDEATSGGVRTPNHQSQYLYFEPGRNELYLPMPSADPSTRREYHLSSIHLIVYSGACPDGARLELLKLFQH